MPWKSQHADRNRLTQIGQGHAAAGEERYVNGILCSGSSGEWGRRVCGPDAPAAGKDDLDLGPPCQFADTAGIQPGMDDRPGIGRGYLNDRLACQNRFSRDELTRNDATVAGHGNGDRSSPETALIENSGWPAFASGFRNSIWPALMARSVMPSTVTVERPSASMTKKRSCSPMPTTPMRAPTRAR